MIKSVLSAALLIAAVSISPAQAEVDDGLVRVVPTSDLNLQAANGIVQLDRRIEAAVVGVCGTVEDIRDLTMVERVHACRAAARLSAAKQRTAVLAAAKGNGQAVLAVR